MHNHCPQWCPPRASRDRWCPPNSARSRRSHGQKYRPPKNQDAASQCPNRSLLLIHSNRSNSCNSLELACLPPRPRSPGSGHSRVCAGDTARQFARRAARPVQPNPPAVARAPPDRTANCPARQSGRRVFQSARLLPPRCL